MEPTPWSRRRLLTSGVAGAAGLLVLPQLLTACGDDGSDATASGAGSSSPDLGPLDFQLSWVKENSFAGLYIADQLGYFADQGFGKVTLMSGGPNVAPDSVVASGKALIGTTNTDSAASAILAGSGTVVVASHFLKNPVCIVSLADDPISEPSDMVGRKIGVNAYNEATFKSFLALANVDPASVEIVAVQYDPAPLTTGEVQGFMGFANNQPAALQAQGFEIDLLMFADFGNELVQESVIVKTSTLAKERDTIKAALLADIMGWRKSIEDPNLGPKFAVEIYGKDLGNTLEQLELSSQLQKGLVYPPSAETNGVLMVTEDLQSMTVETLGMGGIDISAKKLFDMSLMEELYGEHPELLDPIA